MANPDLPPIHDQDRSWIEYTIDPEGHTKFSDEAWEGFKTQYEIILSKKLKLSEWQEAIARHILAPGAFRKPLLSLPHGRSYQGHQMWASILDEWNQSQLDKRIDTSKLRDDDYISDLKERIMEGIRYRDEHHS